MGLATSLSITTRHNGYLDLRTKVGEGTVYYLYLPASPDQKMTANLFAKTVIQEKKNAEAMADMVGAEIDKEVKKPAVDDMEVFEKELPEISGREKPVDESPDSSDKEKLSVLIMDDDAKLRSLLAQMLQLMGYEVEAAPDGETALKIYRRKIDGGESFFAVILDLTIPEGMGGQETVKKMLEIDPSVTAIVSSGYCDEPVVANFSKYGFKGILPKPYTIEQLAQLLEIIRLHLG